jgi:hypothetical protein
MTQEPYTPAPTDALLARYHAAQAALDAPEASGPSAQARTNILKYAGEVATNSVAVPAIKQGASGLLDTEKPAANDNQWKIRALATVAIFGLTSLLLLQWDRGTPQEKEVAFSASTSTARPPVAARSDNAAAPAPAAAPAAPALPRAEPPSDVAAVSKDTAQVKPALAAGKQEAHARHTEPNQSAKISAPKIAQQSAITEPPDSVEAATAANASARAPSEPPGSAMGAVSKAAPSGSSKDDAAVAQSVEAPAARPASPAAASPATPAMRVAPADKAAPNGAEQSLRREDAPSSAARMKKSEAADTESGMQDRSAQAARRDGAAPNTALFAAIRSSDAAGVQQALANGADKNAKSNGIPAITLCVQSGKLNLVLLLAAAGADVNAPDAQGITPLAHARARGFDAMANALVGLGAN